MNSPFIDKIAQEYEDEGRDHIAKIIKCAYHLGRIDGGELKNEPEEQVDDRDELTGTVMSGEENFISQTEMESSL